MRKNPDNGIDCKYEAPAEVFMAIELQPGALAGKSGRVQYCDGFSNF
jgi:predicted N-acetyltransferase YhbS